MRMVDCQRFYEVTTAFFHSDVHFGATFLKGKGYLDKSERCCYLSEQCSVGWDIRFAFDENCICPRELVETCSNTVQFQGRTRRGGLTFVLEGGEIEDDFGEKGYIQSIC